MEVVAPHGRVLTTTSELATLQAELSTKQRELQQLQASFDEFTQSSHELEQELEQELTRAEQQNGTLHQKVQRLERDLGDVREKLDTTQHDMRKCETELSALRVELVRVTAIKRTLEQEQDELLTQVRILQATEDDLRHKMEREMEEKVFLLSDQEELEREHALVTERLRTEVMDLKSELLAVQQKHEGLLQLAVEKKDKTRDLEQVVQLHDALSDAMEVEDDSDLATLPRLSTLQERDESDREQLIETLERELDVLSARLYEETEARERLELEVLEAQDSLAQAEAMENEMAEMADELIEKSQEIRHRDLKIQSLDEEVGVLKVKNAELLEANAELRQSTMATHENDDAMQDDGGDKDDKAIASLRLQCEQLEEAEQLMRERLADEQQLTAQLREENDELVVQVKDNALLRQQLEHQLDAHVKKKQKQLDELTELNATLRRQLESAAEKAAVLEEKASAAAASMSSASSPTSSSSGGHSNNDGGGTSDTEVHRLTAELQTLRAKVQSLQVENARLETSEATSSALLPNKRVSAALLQVTYTPHQLADKYLTERTRNAALLSRLQTVCGNIQVFCRVRPVIGEELAKAQGTRLGVNVVNQSDVAALEVRPDRIFPGSDGTQPADADDGDLAMLDMTMGAAWKVFTFDRVLGPEETQLDVFREVEPVAQSVVEGFKACIFTYGQTGSGKTHTMEGTPSDPGLNYRVLSHIFQSVVLRGAIYDPNRMEEDLGEEGEKREGSKRNEVCYHIQVGVLEIYNESLRDLVDPANPKTLEIRQDSTTGDIVVPQLTMATASSPETTIEILRNAQANRVTGKTDVHAHSSRSHSIVILQISTRTSSTPTTTEEDEHALGSYVSGKLYMVDLAGSERVKKSNVSGAMLKEAAHINKSLSALADVMEALDKKQAHVPYRNSKLTYLLQDVLNTSCKTVMIVNCGPTIESASETFRSLQLAERVRNVVVGRNSIVKNKKEILSAKRAFSEIQSLKQQIQVSERKIKQSQQTVVAMKRDQKHQSEQVVTTLQSRLKAAEAQASNLKTQADTMKRLNDELAQQVKHERDLKQKEADQRDAAQRTLRQLTSKTRVSSSHQELLEKQLKDREDEVKKLRQLLTEARQRTATSVIPRHKGSVPTQAPAKKARTEQEVEPANNQDEGESMDDDENDAGEEPQRLQLRSTSSVASTKIPLPRFGFTRQASASVSNQGNRKPTVSTKSDSSAVSVSKFRRTMSASSSQASTSGASSVQRRGWK